MSDKQHEQAQESTGTDILSIVMDFQHGRHDAGQTMERIAEYCEAYGEALSTEGAAKDKVIQAAFDWKDKLIDGHGSQVQYLKAHEAWERFHKVLDEYAAVSGTQEPK